MPRMLACGAPCGYGAHARQPLPLGYTSMGSDRMRLPVSTNNAFATAGAIAGSSFFPSRMDSTSFACTSLGSLSRICRAPNVCEPKYAEVGFGSEVIEGTQALRLRYEAHAAAAGLQVGEAPRQGGGSDANLLAAHGVPCIDGLGPAGEHFHNPKEWSSLASLRRRTQALACLLAEEAGATGAEAGAAGGAP